jgi:carbon storage regulator
MEVRQMDRYQAERIVQVGRGPSVKQGEAVMLCLSRKLNESIVISNNVVVTIIDIRGDKVRLGITAPNSVPVHREEVFQHIQDNGPKRPAA